MVALKELARTASRLFKFRCHFRCVKPVLLADNHVATHLFRIAQKALSNAHKHGRARQVLIRLSQDAQRLTLQVQDNGKGLSRRPSAPPGLGLRIMRHRASLIGASLTVESSGKRGVRVTCTLSLPPNSRAAKPRAGAVAHPAFGSLPPSRKTQTRPG